MINLSDCIALGELIKPHGIKGQLILKLYSLSFDDIKEMEQVFIIIDGLPVPFFIEEFQERAQDSIIIKFDDISSENLAREIINSEVYINSSSIGNQLSTFKIPDFIGFKVKDINRCDIGILDSLLDIEQNPIMRILKNKKEILIPLQPEFLISYDINTKELIVNCPEGLLELYT